MNPGNCRLEQKEDRLYSGQMLDRSRPVQFTLDGETFEGFSGDTVLSALLANGVDTFGHFRGEPVALDDRLHPPVAHASERSKPAAALSMNRTPIFDGMKLVSLAEADTKSTGLGQNLHRTWRRLRHRLPSSLGLDPETVSPFPGPWTEVEPETVLSADLIVVGAGAGGLSAARAGAACGWSVLLLEQMATPGGDASFFGSVEGEARAPDVISGMMQDLTGDKRVSILTFTEVLSVSGGLLRAHQTLVEGDRPRARVIGFRAPRVVLAPGAHERLPLFAGNRLPGVTGARAAHRLAASFGVWRGKKTVINTASSAATQVALQAADLGVEVLKLTDSRADPHSHFFDFAKAYGVLLATGLRVRGVEQTEQDQLEVSFELSGAGKAAAAESLTTDRLLVCGGWQSDLTLWNMAGGNAAWDPDRQQLRAKGEIEGVSLAGWCQGATGITSCIQSGEEAVARLSGTRVSGHTFPPPSRKMESDDGQLPLSRPVEDSPRCFLDNGYSFSVLSPRSDKPGLIARALGLGEKETGLELRALSLNDVSAKVILGEITPGVAGDFAKERCVTPGLPDTVSDRPASPPNRSPTPNSVVTPPEFLNGRFGSEAGLVELQSTLGLGLEPGCLIFRSSNQSRPEQAIGVVLGMSPSKGETVLAYLARDRIAGLQRLVVRMGARTVELTVPAE